MAFVSFSSQLVVENTTAISNAFIDEHIPTCNGDCARVYLYGLYLCNSGDRYDNTLEHFSQVLGLSEDDIMSSFLYWQEAGLVQILSVKPVQIKYLPIKASASKIRKYSQDKYSDFNIQIQSIIEGRMITPTEFSEYYAFLESLNVEPTALIMIAKYCVDLKGSDVGYNYILTVAKNWAYAGIRTVEAVEEKLDIQHRDAQGLLKILKNLSLKRMPEPSDYELLSKWRKMGYSQATLERIAKDTKGGIAKMDNIIGKYFELKLFELNEIENYQKLSKDLISLAYTINKKIGVYYETVESIVAEYLVPWQQKGFDADTLLSVATFCFKTGRRTLADMDTVIARFYKLGITTVTAIDAYINEKVAQDSVIKDLLSRLGVTREVVQIDRDFYTTWTDIWNFTKDIIDYTATLACGKISPMSYMNKILASFYERKITTLDAAKATSYTPPTVNITRHSYSDEELRKRFKNLEEVDF